MAKCMRFLSGSGKGQWTDASARFMEKGKGLKIYKIKVFFFGKFDAVVLMGEWKIF